MKEPIILHADVLINERGRVVIRMREGYSFYDQQAYDNKESECITYSKYGVFAPDVDFNNRIIVVSDEDLEAIE